VLELELPPTDGPASPTEEAESAFELDPLSEPPADGTDDFDDAAADLPIQAGFGAFERSGLGAEWLDDAGADAGSAGLVGLLDLVPVLAEERLSSEREEPRLLSEFLDGVDDAPDADEGGEEGPANAAETMEELPPSDDDENGEVGLDSLLEISAGLLPGMLGLLGH
jgi:hypothetical protein